jgi:hypothetical protein
VQRIGCLAHSRRCFYQGVKESVSETVWIIAQIRQLYLPSKRAIVSGCAIYKAPRTSQICCDTVFSMLYRRWHVSSPRSLTGVLVQPKIIRSGEAPARPSLRPTFPYQEDLVMTRRHEKIQASIFWVCLALALFVSACGQQTPPDTRAADESAIRDLDAQ